MEEVWKRHTRFRPCSSSMDDACPMAGGLLSCGDERVGDGTPEKGEVVGLRTRPRPMDVVALYDTTNGTSIGCVASRVDDARRSACFDIQIRVFV